MIDKKPVIVKPLVGSDDAPVFDEPWQVQVLAITDSLIQEGLFSATTWSQTLGATLRNAETAGEDDGQETYYRCVLTALETLITKQSDIDQAAMLRKQDEWKMAYLSTPHGQPAELK